MVFLGMLILVNMENKFVVLFISYRVIWFLVIGEEEVERNIDEKIMWVGF